MPISIVRSESEVLWAVATRVQARPNVFVVPDSFCNIADPSARGILSDKIGIDATAPLENAPNPIVLEPGAVGKARQLLDRLDQ